jgi:hypothetical protein
MTAINNRRSIFGSGLSFPPRIGPDGRMAWSSGETNIRQALQILLLTEPGERLMRESFGCGLRRFLFEPNTPATRQLIRDAVQQAIGRWEPRLSLEEVEVEADPLDARLVNIHILYRLEATQAIDSLGLSLQLEG